MALKPDRNYNEADIDIRHVSGASVTAEAGQMLVRSTTGSGSLLQGARPIVTRAANPSGTTPAGMVMHDIVSIDETRYHRNFHKYEMKQGEPCELAKKGTFTTNNYVGSPTQGALAYLSSSGAYTPTVHPTGGLVATPLVGEFEGAPDEDGYVSIRIELPRT